MRKILLLITILLSLSLTGAICKRKPPPDGGVFISYNKGQTWEAKNFVQKVKKKIITISDVDIEQLRFAPSDKNIIYIGTTQNGVYKTENGGDNWIPTSLNSGKISALAVDPFNPSQVYAAQGNSLLKSTDGGQNWRQVFKGVQEKEITSLLIHPTNSALIYLGSASGEVFLSEDYGENWTMLIQFEEPIKFLNLNPQNPQEIYIVTSRHIYKSTDGGRSVLYQGENKKKSLIEKDLEGYRGATNIHSLFVVYSHPQIIYLGTEYGLFKSINGGINWQFVKTLVPPRSTAIKNVVVNNQNIQEIYFTVGKVIHKSTDGGVTWQTLETIPTSRDISQLSIKGDEPNILYAGTKKVKK